MFPRWSPLANRPLAVRWKANPPTENQYDSPNALGQLAVLRMDTNSARINGLWQVAQISESAFLFL